MITMVLSHPRAAGVITMVAIAVISFALALVITGLSQGVIIKRKIDRLTDNALSERDEQIAVLKVEIVTLGNQVNALQARMSGVAVFLGKAVELTGGT